MVCKRTYLHESASTMMFSLPYTRLRKEKFQWIQPILHASYSTYLVLSDVSRTHDLNGLRTLLATSNATKFQVLLPIHIVLCHKWDSSRSLHLTSH